MQSVFVDVALPLHTGYKPLINTVEPVLSGHPLLSGHVTIS